MLLLLSRSYSRLSSFDQWLKLESPTETENESEQRGSDIQMTEIDSATNSDQDEYCSDIDEDDEIYFDDMELENTAPLVTQGFLMVTIRQMPQLASFSPNSNIVSYLCLLLKKKNHILPLHIIMAQTCNLRSYKTTLLDLKVDKIPIMSYSRNKPAHSVYQKQGILLILNYL